MKRDYLTFTSVGTAAVAIGFARKGREINGFTGVQYSYDRKDWQEFLCYDSPSGEFDPYNSYNVVLQPGERIFLRGDN